MRSSLFISFLLIFIKKNIYYNYFFKKKIRVREFLKVSKRILRGYLKGASATNSRIWWI